eukprot:tig00001164_g7415.t1
MENKRYNNPKQEISRLEPLSNGFKPLGALAVQRDSIGAGRQAVDLHFNVASALAAYRMRAKIVLRNWVKLLTKSYGNACTRDRGK